MADETNNTNSSDSVSPEVEALRNFSDEVVEKLNAAGEIARNLDKRLLEVTKELRSMSKEAKAGRDKELLKIVSQIQQNQSTFTADFLRKLPGLDNRDNLARELLNWLKSSKNNNPPQAANSYGQALQFIARFFGVNSAYASTWSTSQRNVALHGIDAARGTPMEYTLRAHDALYNLTHADSTTAQLFHAGRGVYNGLKGWLAGRAAQAEAAAGATGGAGAAAAGGAAGGALGVAATIALTIAIRALQKTVEAGTEQAKKMWQENKDTMLGDAFVFSRMAMGAGGNFQMFGDVPYNVADYMQYRGLMRKRGLRDDEAIARNLMQWTGAGFSLRDANALSIDEQSLKQRMGFEFERNFLRSLYVGTQNSRGSMFSHGDGSFGIGGFTAALGAVAKRSETNAGVRLGIGDQARIIENMTKDMLGMGNSIETVVAALDSFSKQLTTGKLTTQEFVNMFNGFNDMSSQNRLNLIAMSQFGSGNLTDEYFQMVSRSRDAGGRVTNWRENSRILLDVLRRNGGTTPANALMLGDVGGVFDMFGAGSLKNNPNALELLENAASGNQDAIKELNRVSESEKDLLSQQAATLDAIRKPVEHMRDFIFAAGAKFVQDTAGFFGGGSKLRIDYEATRLGLTSETERADYQKFVQDQEEAERNDNRYEITKILSALKEDVNKSHEWMDRLIAALNGNKDAVQENTSRQGGGRVAVGKY